MTRKTTDKLQTVIEVKDNGSVNIRKHRGEVEKLGASGGKALASLKTHWLAYAAALTGAFVIGKKIVALAGEQERVEKRLSFAVKAAGLEVQGTTTHLTAYASQLQRTTGIGDEAIIPIQAMLIQLGRLSGEGLDRATALTLDFATAMGVDYKAAAILMAKAAAGSTEALSRYGIVLDEGIPKGEKFNVLLDIMQQKFGGTAEADLDTYAGSMRAFQSALGDFGETLGDTVLPALTGLLKVLTSILQVFSEPVPPDSFMALTAGVAQAGGTGGLTSAAASGFMRGDRTVTNISAPSGAVPGAGTGAIRSMGIMQDEEGNTIVDDSFVGAWKLRNEIQRQAFAASIQIEDEGQSISLEQYRFFEETKTGITREQALARVEATRQGFQALATMFPKMKGLAIGEAIISTYQGVAKALGSAPPPLNFVAAGLVFARGMAAVQAIQSQGITGGGGTSTYSYGGASQAINTPVSGQAQDITLEIKGADNLVNKQALGEMFFDTFGELAEARGGVSGNIKINFVEN